MSAWIGAIAAVIAIMVGVWLTAWSNRVYERRRTIEQATQELALLAPHVVAGMGAYADVETRVGSEWWERRERVLMLLVTIRVSARFPMWCRTAIRAEAEDLIARFDAVERRFSKGIRLLPTEQHWLVPADLHRAVFRGSDPLDRLAGYYESAGVAHPAPAELRRRR